MPETDFYRGRAPNNPQGYPWSAFPPYGMNNPTIFPQSSRYPQPQGYYQPCHSGPVEAWNNCSHVSYPNMQHTVPYFPHHYHQQQSMLPTTLQSQAANVADLPVLPVVPSATTEPIKTILEEFNSVCRKKLHQ